MVCAKYRFFQVGMGLTIGCGADVVRYFIMTNEGDRNERVEKTLINIGPVVVNGGFSPFLVLVLLITSQ
jgi:hypothetical protein